MTAAELLARVADAGFRVVVAGDGPMLVRTRPGAACPPDLLAALTARKIEVVGLVNSLHLWETRDKAAALRRMELADERVARWGADGTRPEIVSAVVQVAAAFADCNLTRVIEWCAVVESVAHEHRGK